jgi:hypothetical protein
VAVQDLGARQTGKGGLVGGIEPGGQLVIGLGLSPATAAAFGGEAGGLVAGGLKRARPQRGQTGRGDGKREDGDEAELEGGWVGFAHGVGLIVA